MSSYPVRAVTWALQTASHFALLGVSIVILVGAACADGGGGDGGDFSSRFPSIHTFETDDYHSLAYSPNDDGVVLFGHHGGVQMSEDNGDSWSIVIDEPGRDAMNLVYDPFTLSTVYMAGHDVYYRSNDGGNTWSKVDSNLPGLDLHTFAASPKNDGRLYAVPVGYGLHVSDDGGLRWRLLSSDAPQGSNSIVELPDGGLLIGATDQGILRSEDGGGTWTQSRTGIEYGAIYTIRGDPMGKRLYVGTDHGVYTSGDGGKTWIATALDDTWIVAIGVDPSNPDIVLAVDRGGNLYRSNDGGKTWG
jgi:photosystem II stability/assembly factor-like uncharacterized protein